MKYILLLLILSILFSCRSARCISEKEAVSEFKQKIELIRSYRERNLEVYKEDFLSAIIYLTNITGIASKAEYSHAFGYLNDQHYREDIQGWSKWFETNKCRLTKSYVDSAMSKLQR